MTEYSSVCGIYTKTNYQWNYLFFAIVCPDGLYYHGCSGDSKILGHTRNTVALSQNRIYTVNDAGTSSVVSRVTTHSMSAETIKVASSCCALRKARRTRAHLSRVLVIRDKLDRQNFLVCGQHLRHFRHSWHVNQISNMFDIFRHSWQKNSRVRRANDIRAWIGKFAHACNLQN